MIETNFEWRGDARGIGARILEQNRCEPGAGAIEIGAQSQRVHAPSDATRVPERAGDQLIERMAEQLAFANRREERECRHDRLGGDAAHDRLGNTTGGEQPEPPADRSELRRHRFLRQRGQRAECTDAELAQAAVNVKIERKNGDGLGSEKLLLFANGDNDRFAPLGAACGDPSCEFSSSPTQTE